MNARVVLLTAILLAQSTTARLASPASKLESPDEIQIGHRAPRGDVDTWVRNRSALRDTVWFGGSGTGDGSVVRNGVWDWEADSGETPEYFLDGDPVGNQYRDGWTFVDWTARNGPSRIGTGHWSPDGTYDFANKDGAYVHRATFHTNDGIDDGPDPLASPANPGSMWSVWIGTNLYLNPEHCAWAKTAGYGDGWSQGLWKRFEIDAAAGTQVDLSFFHRYAVEADWDTNWVEISHDGLFWDQVGSASNGYGLYSGGTKDSPLPIPTGAGDVVPLMVWPGGQGSLFVRFRLQSDQWWSDEGDSPARFYAWQIDDVGLQVGGSLVDFADFEEDLGGWQLARFESWDFDLTLEPGRSAGRIEHLSQLSCPLVMPCPEACDIDGNILVFCDRDECGLHDVYQASGVNSPVFAIGGPGHPDIDNLGGRIVKLSGYADGGAGMFGVAWKVCWYHWPSNTNSCPRSPPGGAPGHGEIFDWSRALWNQDCGLAGLGTGPQCVNEFLFDVSYSIPAEADSIILHVGIYSECGHFPTCDVQDSGTPFYDNLRFGVYDPEGLNIAQGIYATSFPLAEQAHGGMNPLAARSDGPRNAAIALPDNPTRFVRMDSMLVTTGAQGVAAFLRFKVVPGPCQDLSNPFFSAFPPHAWHEARMDVAADVGFAACFHASDPHDGTSWGGEAMPVEPCDDILPDGVFTAGTQVLYFTEMRDEITGETVGTEPAGDGFSPIDTLAQFAPLWRQFSVLPELIPPPAGGCDPLNPNDRANSLLLVSNTGAGEVDRGRSAVVSRVLAILDSFGLDYDYYANLGPSTNGIGRREDRIGQQPRPPVNGATSAQLDPYDCIWFLSGLRSIGTLTDSQTNPESGGHPSADLQKLELWLRQCDTDLEERLLIQDGYGWASDIDNRTVYGPAFLDLLGVDVLQSSYEQLSGDLRRCARITGVPGTQPPGHDFDGEIYGTGCPETWEADVLTPVSGGQVLALYVDSHEGGFDPVQCGDDTGMPAWAAIIRQAAGANSCRRSVAMGVSSVYLNALNCTDECLYEEWSVGGGTNSPAQLLADVFEWANLPIGSPVAIPGQTAPPVETRLLGGHPNPANPSATILFSLARTGPVRLRVFDVTGRLVRTLVDERLESEAEPYKVVWDGRGDAGQTLASGVFFYQLDAPCFTSAKKLILLK